jgi:RND family efflux transporter MFP subunit
MEPAKPALDDLRIHRREKPQSRFRIWIPVALLVFLVAAGITGQLIARGRAVEVRTAVAREISSGGGNERTVLNASGYVVARRAATVSAKVTGKVVEVLIEEGMRVKERQVLARLDDTNTKASLRLAEAQLDSAKSALEETRALLTEANSNLRRTADLAKNQVASQADLDHAEAEAKSLQARLARQEVDVTVAERQVTVWEQQLDDTIVRAPFAGVVTTKDAQPGEMISPISAGGGFTRTGIGTVVDMESLEIEIDVSENYINRVQSGQPVEATLDAYPEWKIPCKVIAIIPTADRQKATVKVRVGFDKLDPRILPQMGVKVAFRETSGSGGGSATRSIIIPKGAVQQQDGRDVVFVVQNGRAQRRAISILSRESDEVTVGSGISGGERVIVSGAAGLKEGAAVKEAKS